MFFYVCFDKPTVNQCRSHFDGKLYTRIANEADTISRAIDSIAAEAIMPIFHGQHKYTRTLKQEEKREHSTQLPICFSTFDSKVAESNKSTLIQIENVIIFYSKSHMHKTKRNESSADNRSISVKRKAFTTFYTCKLERNKEKNKSL